jgi:hypothetical protein
VPSQEGSRGYRKGEDGDVRATYWLIKGELRVALKALYIDKYTFIYALGKLAPPKCQYDFS